MEIKLTSGIKEIPVTDENGELICTLKIDTSDGNTATRFANIINNLKTITTEYREKHVALQEKLQGADDMDVLVNKCELEVEFINRLIAEIEAVFGAGVIRQVYAKHYEMNPDYLPDESTLGDFVAGAIPVMNQLFNQRFDENRKKYNINRRGANE